MFNVRSALLTDYRNVLNIHSVNWGTLELYLPPKESTTKREETGYSSDGVSSFMRIGRDELCLITLEKSFSLEVGCGM